MKFSDAAVRNAKADSNVQKLSDGGGLYLHVTPTGSKLWRMAYRFEGKQKLLSFGAYPSILAGCPQVPRRGQGAACQGHRPRRGKARGQGRNYRQGTRSA